MEIMAAVLRIAPALALAAAALVFPVAAQEYPARPVRFIVSTAPGTTVDVTARFLGAKLAEEWGGAAIVVENRIGANGAIASEFVARAPADGYTLLFTAGSHYAARWMVARLPYDPVEDFRPVARVGIAYLVLVTPSSAKANSLADLIAEMKARPGDLVYSSAGNGSATHLTSVLLTSMAGVTARHAPYKGAAQALTDTIGGQVQFTFAGIATASSHLKAGRLKALGVSGPRRSQSLPDVPAIAEAGLPGYELTTLVGALAPRATPPAVIRKLSNALMKLAGTPEYRAFATLQGMEADLADTDKFSAEAPLELEHWRKVIALSGAKAD
jgi:tripartite-type tricarboxylate transporter receptor subunit TctC